MRKQCKRKHYATGHILLPSQRDKIVMPVHVCMSALEMGSRDLHHRHTIAAFLNIVGVCAKRMRTAAETIEIVERAKYVLVDADQRYIRTGSWVFTGPEMLSVRHAITLGDEIMKRANSAVLTYAVDFVGRINAKTPEVLGSAEQPLTKQEIFYE